MIWTVWLQKLQKHLCNGNSNIIIEIRNKGHHKAWEHRAPSLPDPCSKQQQQLCSEAAPVRSAVPLPKDTAASGMLDFPHHSASWRLPCTNFNSPCCNLGRNLKTRCTFCILEGPSPKYITALLGNTSDGSPQHHAGKSYAKAFWKGQFSEVLATPSTLRGSVFTFANPVANLSSDETSKLQGCTVITIPTYLSWFCPPPSFPKGGVGQHLPSLTKFSL